MSMKFTNIKQLIIKFVGGGIINFPTRFLRWIKINGDIDGSDDGGGDTPSSMNLDDFKNFNLSIPNNTYWLNHNPGDILQFNEVFNAFSIDVFKALTSLTTDSDVDIFPSINFAIINGVEGGTYRHNIVISPKNGLNYNIDITSNGQYTEGDMVVHEYCNIHLYFNGETLEVISISEGE